MKNNFLKIFILVLIVIVAAHSNNVFASSVSGKLDSSGSIKSTENAGGNSNTPTSTPPTSTPPTSGGSNSQGGNTSGGSGFSSGGVTPQNPPAQTTNFVQGGNNNPPIETPKPNAKKFVIPQEQNNITNTPEIVSSNENPTTTQQTESVTNSEQNTQTAALGDTTAGISNWIWLLLLVLVLITIAYLFNRLNKKENNKFN